MGFGAGQIVYEDDLALFIARETYQEITTVSVVASTTLVDVPGSTITVVAGATYWLEVWIAYNGPIAGDAKFAWEVSDANITLDRNILAPAKTINSTASQRRTIARPRRLTAPPTPGRSTLRRRW